MLKDTLTKKQMVIGVGPRKKSIYWLEFIRRAHKLSLHDKSATIAYDNRRRHLERFLKTRKSGSYHRELAIWADEQGLCTRTAKQYWQRTVWKGLIEINGDSWKLITDNTRTLKNEGKKTGQEAIVEAIEETAVEYMRRRNKEKAALMKNELQLKLRDKISSKEEA